ncbi:MAG: TIGR03086 family metal-binding protein [Actinomycetota bacterium]|nr:TIGR03086 family metal-binding protein [Actinomycetota bacterium]
MIEALDTAFAHTHRVVSGIDPDQLDGPTPCPEWDLRTLLGHMIAVVANCGRGAGGDALLPNPLTVPLRTDLASQFRDEADRTLAAWRACAPYGEVDIGAGPMPTPAAMAINLLDTSAHSWDIARATGQNATLPDELATTLLGLSGDIVKDEFRAFAGFDPPVPVPAESSATDQLVAFLGRRP